MKWNHKRIERVYVKLGMNKRRRKMKRRVPNPEKSPLLQPLAPNITWSADFMHNRLENGRKVREFNIIDDYDRQALMCEVGIGFQSEEVVGLSKQLIDWGGKHDNIQTDNGKEFITKAVKKI